MKEVTTLGFSEGFVSTPKTSGSIEDFNLMQFTGLLDKNGKEIYEGDIVRLDKECYFSERINFDYPERVGVVEYNSASFFMAKDTSSMLSYCVHASSITSFWGEVIGNIYENPELLSTKE